MDVPFPQTGESQRAKIKLAQFRDLAELESGGYWPQLQPYFIKPYFRRLTYRLTAGRTERPASGSIQSIRGASGFGELDIAYIADRPAMAMSITDTGLPDFCLTIVQRGALAYRSGAHE